MVKRGLNVKLLDDVVEKLMMGVPPEKSIATTASAAIGTASVSAT